jgi:hypothetical protein
MSEIVNLRLARKRAARREREAEAAGNRAKHGLGKAERERLETEAAKMWAALDGAKRDA